MPLPSEFQFSSPSPVATHPIPPACHISQNRGRFKPVAQVVDVDRLSILTPKPQNQSGEVEKARTFVLRMPLFILDQDRLDIFLTFFQYDDDDHDEDEDDVKPAQPECPALRLLTLASATTCLCVLCGKAG